MNVILANATYSSYRYSNQWERLYYFYIAQGVVPKDDKSN